MKKLLFLLSISTMISCSEKEIPDQFDIYNEWRWELTTFDTRGKPITAEETDSTYFYNFQKIGVLERKNINKEIVDSNDFEIIIDDEFNRIIVPDLDIIWGYKISNDTLKIWEPSSIYPKVVIFKAD